MQVTGGSTFPSADHQLKTKEEPEAPRDGLNFSRFNFPAALCFIGYPSCFLELQMCHQALQKGQVVTVVLLLWQVIPCCRDLNRVDLKYTLVS